MTDGIHVFHSGGIADPLVRVYGLLTPLMHSMHEAEAVVEVTIEELGEIVILADGDKAGRPGSESKVEIMIEYNLKEIMLRSQGRVSSAGPSHDLFQVFSLITVVTIDQDNSLHYIKFMSTLHERIPRLSISPEVVQKLHNEASQKVVELQKMSKILDEDEEVRSISLDESTKKRLGASIERWSKLWVEYVQPIQYSVCAGNSERSSHWCILQTSASGFHPAFIQTRIVLGSVI